jgi:hypothetical protein
VPLLFHQQLCLLAIAWERARSRQFRRSHFSHRLLIALELISAGASVFRIGSGASLLLSGPLER